LWVSGLAINLDKELPTMTRILLSSAALAALLSACATPPPPPPLMAPPPVVQPVLSQAGMDCVVRLNAANQYEVQAAQVALQRSTNPDVRNFAQMMIDQHTAAIAQVGGAMQSINMAPPPVQLTPDLTARLNGLGAAGPNFDAAYLQDQIAAHQDALALAQSCAANGGPPIAAVAGGLVPAIQDHLNRAQALAANLGRPTGERG
jgi:putative membrane protein